MPGDERRRFNITATIMFMLPLRRNLFTGAAESPTAFPAAPGVQTLRSVVYRMARREEKHGDTEEEYLGG